MAGYIHYVRRNTRCHWKASLKNESGKPGTVIAANKHGLQVACGDQSLLIEEVKPAGVKMMPASSWVAGKGPKTGDQLGL